MFILCFCFKKQDPLFLTRCFKQFFAKGQHFTYDLDDIARYYKDYKKIMLFWNELYPGSIYTVNYENVINNPEHDL